MPSNRRKPAEPVIPTNSMVASAARYPGEAAQIYRQTSEWQKECYRHYNICGEARYAANFFGHSMSRATLAMKRQGPDGLEDGSPAAIADLDALFNGKQGQAQMLEAIGLHLTIAGECYLVGRETFSETDGTTADHWEVVSILEMMVAGTKWQIKYDDDRPPVTLGKKDVVIRIWRPHPAKRMEADSPFRSLLPILEEIEYLTLHIFAQIRSRLAGAGLLLIASGIDFPPPPNMDAKVWEAMGKAEQFMHSLGANMIEPIKNPGLPSAVVPLVGIVDAEYVDKFNHLEFWSPLDEHSKELRDEAIRRFALGMDLPPEQVTGMSSNSGTGGGTSNGISHWGAWQVEESTITLHIEPMLELVTNALTIGYIRPLSGDVKDKVVYDTAALRLRPDRSKESMELYQMGLLKPEVMLKENGFDPKDMLDEEGWKIWALRKVSTGSATPEQVASALKQLGVDIGMPTDDSAPRETRPDPSLEDHPVNPRTPAESAVLAGANALVFRALERAGNRIRQSTGVKPEGVPAYEMHTLHSVNGNADTYLNDAWSCAPQVLEGLGDVDALVQNLDAYCKNLFAEQALHTRDRLQRWLTATGG